MEKSFGKVSADLELAPAQVRNLSTLFWIWSELEKGQVEWRYLSFTQLGGS